MPAQTPKITPRRGLRYRRLINPGPAPYSVLIVRLHQGRGASVVRPRSQLLSPVRDLVVEDRLERVDPALHPLAVLPEIFEQPLLVVGQSLRRLPLGHVVHDDDDRQHDRHEDDGQDEDAGADCDAHLARLSAAALLRCALRLQVAELLRDRVLALELGELVLEVLLYAEIVGFGVRLEIVDPPLELVELYERVVDPVTVQALARL